MNIASLYQEKEAFLKYLDSFKGYSPHSILNYDVSIQQMLDKAEITEEEGAIKINLMPLRLQIASQKPKTIASKLSAIRSFVSYLREQGYTVELRGDESIKVPKTLPKPISHDHIMSALQHADPLSALVITLLYSMGLRISELSNLKVNDVTKEWCRVMGKGKKERDIPMIPEVYRQFKTFQASSLTKEYVFEALGKKLSENSLRYSLVKAFKDIGLRVTPHQLRHSYATELLNHGARIADVSELLGHASMATTQIYTKLGNALKMDNYLKSHPLCQHSEDVSC
ncbi:MAG: tyrosine-type recombinase/integrase [Campylobacterales bacterium]|nr:tyrosine-type recombinase/integrase [Campylobacterales bacterium]